MANISSAHAAIPSHSIIERYSLLIDDHGDGSKGQQPKFSAYVVRLTDASLKTLNEAIAEAKRDKSRAKLGYVEIQSNGNESALSFGGAAATEHRFSMLDAQRDLGPTGQLEAIVEAKSSTNSADVGGRMKSIGSIMKRLNISATTRDTFESVKEKTKRADEEMRRNSAKVLKGPATRVGKKVWEKISKAVSLSDTSPPPRKRVAMERKPENATGATLSTALSSFEARYPSIRTVEERSRYKEEFDREYPSYMEAYERLRRLALEFEQLGEKLKAAPKSSPERRAVEKEILDKYKEFENGSESKKWRRRHEELKLKLHILKTRVKEYDDSVTTAVSVSLD